jgi:NADPH-dependent 2,4-dienoyl-CoA reductase/sulfur reductase-like enzyme/rhodanese-related sulfurtransferase
MAKRILIVGGVAGGANAATRLRRLDEKAEIIVFERGPYVSFANCGLPYHVGGEIQERKKLLQHTPETLKARFAIDVRIQHSVEKIDRGAKEVEVRDISTGRIYRERYDNLILSPGAAPFKPPVPGLDLPGVFALRDIPDMDKIIAWITEHKCTKAAIAGGGFIGLEMMEQLHHKGVMCVLFESNPQILTPLDAEMVRPIEAEMREKGISLHLSDPVQAITNGVVTDKGASLKITTKSGKSHQADLVIWSIGVRPETKLAVDAGLELGTTGAVKVNEHLQTSDPAIYAVGDCIEVTHGVTKAPAFIPLAGPANRQGRIAADNICGIPSTYKATYGTAVVRVFSLTAACTGANEKLLVKAGIPYQALHLHPNSHASYYPGAHPLALKVIYNSETGALLGAQAVGKDGVDKRIDVLAVAIQAGLTVDDLVDLELCYAPPFGSAKDPVNLAGMMGDNVRNERVTVAQWSDVDRLSDSVQLVDVRDSAEVARGSIPNAIHIPLNDLRARLSELPTDKELLVFCQSGQRSYNACRILMQNGYVCRNLSGAYKTWSTTLSTNPD